MSSSGVVMSIANPIMSMYSTLIWDLCIFSCSLRLSPLPYYLPYFPAVFLKAEFLAYLEHPERSDNKCNIRKHYEYVLGISPKPLHIYVDAYNASCSLQY